MKLTEAEMRMVFQIESTNQNAALNEIYMTWRYAPNPATKETAEGLLDKLRPLSDQECMDLIRKVQAEYRLPEKARTIGEMLAEARQQSGAQKLSGHDIMALERFDPATRHMIVFSKAASSMAETLRRTESAKAKSSDSSSESCSFISVSASHSPDLVPGL